MNNLAIEVKVMNTTIVKKSNSNRVNVVWCYITTTYCCLISYTYNVSVFLLLQFAQKSELKEPELTQYPRRKVHMVPLNSSLDNPCLLSTNPGHCHHLASVSVIVEVK